MYHWRRHNGFAQAVDNPRITLVATACGHLVDYQQAVGDAEEADCPACTAIAVLIKSPSKLLEDARGIVYSWRHGGGGDNLNARSDEFIAASRAFLDLGPG